MDCITRKGQGKLLQYISCNRTVCFGGFRAACEFFLFFFLHLLEFPSSQLICRATNLVAKIIAPCYNWSQSSRLIENFILKLIRLKILLWDLRTIGSLDCLTLFETKMKFQISSVKCFLRRLFYLLFWWLDIFLISSFLIYLQVFSSQLLLEQSSYCIQGHFLFQTLGNVYTLVQVAVLPFLPLKISYLNVSFNCFDQILVIFIPRKLLENIS